MILESKGGQGTFAVLGLLLLGSGIGALCKLDDVHLNICLGDGSGIRPLLNNLATATVLLLMAALGGAMLWLALYSIRKVRQFKGEPKRSFSWRGLLTRVGVGLGVFAGLAGIILGLDYLTGDAVVPTPMHGRATPPDPLPKLVRCRATVLTWQDPEPDVAGPEWDGIAGTCLLRIDEPASRRGQVLTIRVRRAHAGNALWRRPGAAVSFGIRREDLGAGVPPSSDMLPWGLRPAE